MTTYWLTFKPLGPSAPRGWPIEQLRDLIRRFEDNPDSATEWWRIVSSRSARIGDKIYLFKQGDDPRGIFGTGTIIAGPELRHEPSDLSGAQPRVLVRFTRLVDPTTNYLLRLDELEDIVPNHLIRAQASGNSVPEDVHIELERRLGNPPATPSLDDSAADDSAFDPDSAEDLRQRALRAIRIRRGQAGFRASLLKAYKSRCAITGCAVPDVLEAAHITPYLGPLTNHISNGLLLRADLHTLFDCNLITIHPGTRRVIISQDLGKSAYAKLAERPLRATIDPADSPSRKALQKKFSEFEAQQRLLR